MGGHQNTAETAPDSRTVVAFKTFMSGGIAGCCAKTAVAPLDRVKILLQAHNQHYKHLGVFSAVRHVVRKEGFTGLYQGNGVQMIRIFPYAAIQFLSYEQFKQIARQHILWLNHSPNISKLICGSLAGLTAVMITYPLDMIRARLAFQVRGEAVYDGILHTVKSIRLLEGGTRGLYQGIVPTILGMAPYAGLSFSSFEMLKNFALDTFPEMLGKPQITGGLALILPAKLVCGGLAGAIAQTFSYRLDYEDNNCYYQKWNSVGADCDLEFADNIALLSHTRSQMQDKLRKLDGKSQQLYLNIHVRKTKMM